MKIGAPRTALAATLLTLGTACTDPKASGQEISRHTMDFISAVTAIVGRDDKCGFDSPQAKANERVEGEPGREGVVVREIEDCEIDVQHAQEKAPLVFDCDVAGVLTGNLRVTAQRRVVGRITDDEDIDDRVVPAGPESMTFLIERAELDGFAVRSADQAQYMVVKSGVLSAEVGLKLARDKEGFCAAPTRHAAFKNVNLANADVEIIGAESEYTAFINSSDLTGVRGEYGGEVNTLTGEITIKGSKTAISENAYDADYDPAKFEETFVCDKNTDLAMPLSYDCDGVGGILAQNVGRLSVVGFARIVNELDDNAVCGFENMSVKEKAQLDGTIGGQGTATFAVNNCAIEFPPNTVIDTDCLGKQSLAGGRVIVSARKTIRGRLTGDTYGDPAVPLTDTPATVEVTEMRFENFTINEDGDSIQWLDGTMRGKLTPRIAYDEEDDACSFETDVARFENLSYDSANVVVTGIAGRFETKIDNSNIQATAGKWGEVENALGGTLSLDGKKYSLPTEPNDPGLDPDYERAEYEQRWQCGTLRMPVSYDCNINSQIAQGAARLAPLALGELAELVDDDVACGFENPTVKANNIQTGTLGRPGGNALYDLGSSCRFHWPEVTEIDSDCNGKKTKVRGSVTVRATKRVEGWLTGDPDEPVVPTSRDPAVLDIELEFSDFSIFYEPGDERLTARSGRIRARMYPRAALDIDDEACSIPTPVVTFENITWDDALISVNDEGKRFDVHLMTSTLQGQNGNKDGVENKLDGTLVMDGELWNIPTDPTDIGLDPDYDPVVFDNAYQSCDPLLKMPESEQDCDFKDKLGKESARALVFSSGTITTLVSKDEDCGFSTFDVLTDPTGVTGDEGDYGTMDWAIDNCRIQKGDNDRYESDGDVYDYAERVDEEDCLDRSVYAKGQIVTDARQHVEGERDEVFGCDVVYPLKPNSTIITFEQVLINELTVFDRDPGETPIEKVIVHSGTMSGVAYPMTGKDEDEDDRYTIGTPVAKFERLSYLGTTMTIIDEDGKTFIVNIDGSDIAAYNGAYDNDKNRISGTITIEGRQVTVPQLLLDDEYDQIDFDRRYVCKDDLEFTLPPDRAVGRPN